jgi:hypothetical protein
MVVTVSSTGRLKAKFEKERRQLFRECHTI